MNKIKKVEDLSIGQLKSVLITIVSKEGFINIKNHDNVLEAYLDNPMSPITNIFMVFPFQLSGEVDIDKICEMILQEQSKYSANNVTIVSKNHISNGFQSEIDSRISHFRVNYIGRDRLIKLIDKDYPELWKHDDISLLKYESDFSENVKQENQLRRLKLPSEKCQRLLDIYINPQLFSYEEDTKTHTITRKRADLSVLIAEEKPIILSGDSGTGKSSLLKRLGSMMIEQNEGNIEIKYLPIYVTALDLLKNNFTIKDVVKNKTQSFFQSKSLANLAIDYKICLLIDSIDEFEAEDQNNILKQLGNLYESKGVKYFIGTREPEHIEKICADKKNKSYEISRFNYEQIKRFVSAFFSGDEFKTNNLLDALRENKIIERLPITPLTLSLISILYDETDFEIPATITDIYDNFNDLIVGKAVVSSKVEFIDISFKERILSLYALLLMESKNHKPLSIDEFMLYFAEYYEGKTLPVKDAQLKDVLMYLIHNTGILYIKDDKWVAFTHDSYMEYYAAIEIFKFRREKETVLVENFFDIQWQNVAVFYAGKTKDMPEFAGRINNKLVSSKRWNEYISGIQGCGYLLQALYQTDNKIRRDLVLTALNLVLESDNVLKKMSSDDSVLFRNYRMPILHLMNFIHFYEMFNSITLKAPLQLSYQTLKKELDRIVTSETTDKSVIPIIGYKLLELAFTLDSKRINDSSALEEIVLHSEILKDPSLNIIAQFTLDLMGKAGYKELREDLKRKYSSLSIPLKALIDNPTSKNRFSVLDTVTVERKVKIFVEGKTDAQILEHAFMVLTGGFMPYWKITVATQNGKDGSSTIVSKELDAAFGYSSEYSTIIGIYDHDGAGLREYRGLNNKIYREVEKDSIKKHEHAEVYAITLPIPGEMSIYLQDKQDFNMFEIEHYFGHEYLKANEMLKSTAIPDVFEIRSSGKTSFANTICKDLNPKSFLYFTDLFRIIDKISKVDVNYII